LIFWLIGLPFHSPTKQQFTADSHAGGALSFSGALPKILKGSPRPPLGACPDNTFATDSKASSQLTHILKTSAKADIATRFDLREMASCKARRNYRHTRHPEIGTANS
jgi:hypothetical protein